MNLAIDDDIKVYKKDQIIFKEGDKAQKLYILKSGKIICLKKSKDRLVPINSVSDKSLVGEEALILGEPHSYSAIALEETAVIEIPAKTISAVIKVAPPWLGGLLKTLSDRINETSSVISEHRIIHHDLSGGQELTPQEENRLKKLLA